jgi:hypothetical protein
MATLVDRLDTLPTDAVRPRSAPRETPAGSSLDEFKLEGERALRTLLYLAIAGVIGIVVFSLRAGSWHDSVSVATVAIMIGGASLVVGGLLGFLFGIPRAPHINAEIDETSTTAGTVKSAAVSTTGGGNPYRANTNLEEISDWLTKILVGVGLTQIAQLPGVVKNASEGLRPALGSGVDDVAGGIFGVAASIYFLICGFLLSYLWTRVYLPRAFRWSDAFAALTKEVDRLSRQAELDQQALEAINRQLDPTTPLSQNSEAELTAALKEAGRDVKKLAFFQASNLRENNAGPDGNATLVAKTIPVWRALIALDGERKYYRNHYELAMALALSDPPNWAGAEQSMSSAIKVRDTVGADGWRIMELNRARFVIQQDEGFRAGRASSPEQRNRIERDLQAAQSETSLSSILSQSPELNRWRALNPIIVVTSGPTGSPIGATSGTGGMSGAAGAPRGAPTSPTATTGATGT